MDDPLIPYLAGVIDCDGYVTIQTRTGRPRKTDGHRPIYYTPRIGFTQVDRRICDVLADRFGGAVRRYEAENGGRGYWHMWDITGPRAIDAVRQLLPYLVLKRERAQLVIEYGRLIAEHREAGGRITPEQEAQREALRREIRSFVVRRSPKAREIPPTGVHPVGEDPLFDHAQASA